MELQYSRLLLTRDVAKVFGNEKIRYNGEKMADMVKTAATLPGVVPMSPSDGVVVSSSEGPPGAVFVVLTGLVVASETAAVVVDMSEDAGVVSEAPRPTGSTAVIK